ncbi:drug/metabolite transporter (DMT)-like permease [Methylopila capsulata]|uniref:DMT transporter permease n=1 Tax=Methylopila capsulata TaxID=61654 RepID=A0A9W6IS17_9HYPH|nr:DMT family transporter [Methylopila capsulata]MBM7851457.1 drug/metabolite transporter (DMT)-like permease [Methylopila capsulata]GLK54514.1 DMT transporter permease [Methylopila capsulata]
MSPPPSIASADAAEPASVAAPRIPLPLPSTDNASLAIGLVVAATACFSAGDVAAKMLAATLPAVQVTWMRYTVFATMVVVAALIIGGPRTLRPKSVKLQLLRGVATSSSALFFILGLRSLDVAQATAIHYMSPIFITALSIPLLGERVGAHRWAAAALGFAGVLIVMRPFGASFTLAALLPAAGAMAWALGAVVTRKMAADRPETTLAWSAIVGLALLSVLVPFAWRMPTAHEAGIAIAMGVCSTAGHGLLVVALRRAAASTLAPFSYVQILFAVAVSFVVFGRLPDLWTIAGGAVIAASGVYVAHRERVSSRAPRVSSRFADDPHVVAEAEAAPPR